MKVSIADFAAAFAKPKTDAREGKESLSKSIRNGLKRYNEKTREVVIWLWLFCVEGVKREESPGKSDRGNYLTCRRAAAKISALLSRKGATAISNPGRGPRSEDNGFTDLFSMTFCYRLSRAK
jgi:hypothetical protein